MRRPKAKRLKKRRTQWLVVGVLTVLFGLLVSLAWKIVMQDTVPEVELEKYRVPAMQATKQPRVEQVQPVVPPAHVDVPKPQSIAENHASTALPPAYVQAADHGIALIIDDVGYDLHALKRILNLSIPVAISILPASPKAVQAAEMTHAAGQLVMLHLPMEPSSKHYRDRMDHSFLRVGMDALTIRRMMLQDLDKIPYVEGINNHMGSMLTRMAKPMVSVMQVCREKELFFVDSKTSSQSVAATVAKTYGVSWGSRQVFLDDSVALKQMNKMWKRLERCVEHQQRCIVIGHPHRETLDFLDHKLSILKTWPVVSVRKLLHVPAAE